MTRRTPLHSAHLELGAKMADFGGWDMPIEYAGTVVEHTTVRESVGVFDVSHMGKVRITGPGAIDFVNSMVANDIDRIGAGQAQYSMLCNDAGGIVDDLIVYRLSDDEVFIVPNAANAATVVAALEQGAPEGILVENQHDDLGIIAVQGPQSADVLRTLGLPCDHDYMSVVKGAYADQDLLVCRSGYTGELGFELIVPAENLVALWTAVVGAAQDLGGGPAGLGSRDTLRTEMGYPLHGQDISPTVSPVEAGLGWALGWDKPAFLGKATLVTQREQGPTRRLRGLQSEGRAIPRAHMQVTDAEGRVLGEVTSGTFSPTLRIGIALALLDSTVQGGDEVMVDIRGRSMPFMVAKPPFVPPHVR
ncbi:MAG: glycine cleavage system aminomethyltransferase GcvT [Candidatus Nanopelagicales bacterium]